MNEFLQTQILTELEDAVGEENCSIKEIDKVYKWADEAEEAAIRTATTTETERREETQGLSPRLPHVLPVQTLLQPQDTVRLKPARPNNKIGNTKRERSSFFTLFVYISAAIINNR